MSKLCFQSITITRIQNTTPNLKFVARYSATEVSVKACMHGYANRAFVYLLTSDFGSTEFSIYVGKTKSQYSRFLTHIKKYEFDHIYLFECNPDELNRSEGLIIEELKPLYNRNKNPLEVRYRQILNIDYDAPKTKTIIRSHLHLLKQYEQTGLFGFSLNPAIFSVLERKAKEKGCNCSDMLQNILEQLFPADIALALQNQTDLSITNLATTKEYAELHGCSRELIKQFLREENRISGAKQIGRDWVLPRDADFPEDRRKKCQKKTY